MDNILRQVESIESQGVFVSPVAGDLAVPTCATRDIATVAARLLLDHSWSGREAVEVLGPGDPSFDDMARIMSEVWERRASGRSRAARSRPGERQTRARLGHGDVASRPRAAA